MVLDPFAIVTEVMAAVSPLLRNPPVEELSVRFTVDEPDVSGVPPADCRRTVMPPVDTPGAVVGAVVVNTSTGGATTVTDCDADRYPDVFAVIVGLPAALSR